jgi:hypothetical protein
MTFEENKKWFEENFLDGDKIQKGQMMSSQQAFEVVIEALKEQREKIENKVHKMIDNMLSVSIDYHMNTIVFVRDIENIEKKYFPRK